MILVNLLNNMLSTLAKNFVKGRRKLSRVTNQGINKKKKKATIQMAGPIMSLGLIHESLGCLTYKTISIFIILN